MKNTSDRNIMIVTIPEYILKTLISRGSSLDELGDKLSTINNIVNRNNSEIYLSSISSFNSWLKDRLSLSDIKDLFVANRLVDKKLYGTIAVYETKNLNEYTGYSFMSVLENYDNKRNEQDMIDFVNFLGDKDLDLDTIILNNNTTKVVDIKVTQHVLFVIIKSGFTNIEKFKNSNFVSYFRELVLNSLINAYGEKDVIRHPYYLSYLRLPVK